MYRSTSNGASGSSPASARIARTPFRATTAAPGPGLHAPGGHHGLGPECPGRLKEIPSSVGGGGQEEEKTSHECILATSRRLNGGSNCSRGVEWRMIAEDQASLEPILRISPTA